MRQTRLAFIALVTLVIGLVGPNPAGATTYGPVTSITIPPAVPAGSGGFGMAALDATAQRYFLADPANRGVDIINAATRSYVNRVDGFASGPNAVVVVPSRNEVWATDGDSTVKVIDVGTAAVVATVWTGGSKRADQIAYNPDDDVVIVTNGDFPAFATVISVPLRVVLGRIAFPDATNGLGQAAYDRVGRQFLVAVRATTTNPGGEIVSIDAATMRIKLVFPLVGCNPHGLAMGPDQRFIVGCANSSGPLTTQLMNARSGQVISTIPQVGGIGGVTYSPTTNTYYVAAVDMTTGMAGGATQPVLGIISGETHTWLGNVPLPTGVSRPLQAITVNPVNEEIYLPLKNGTVQVVKNLGGLGGEGFALADASGDRLVALTWQGGTTQTGYSLVRVGSTTGLKLTPLPASATTAVDRIPDADGIACYQLVANTASGQPGLSDVLCSMSSVASGQTTTSFGIQLSQSSLASLFWTIGPAPNSYVLAPLGTSRVQPLRNGTVAVVDDTAGSVTCYTVISITGNQPTGLTDILCGVPGQSNLTGPTGNLALAESQATVQAVVEAIEHMLER